MLDNPDMFESTACFDPNTATHHHRLLINHHQIPNFTAIGAPADHLHHHQHQQHLMNIEIDHQIDHQINWNQMGNTQTPPDLLNLFQLSKCSSSLCFSKPFSHPTQIENSGQILYDPGLPQPPLFRELLNSLPNGFNLTGLGEMENNMERGEQSRLFVAGDGVLEFGAGIININGKGINNNNTKNMKHFATEKHRRQQMGGKFEALKQLIPNPSKADRASIVGDGIEYINELKRTVEELKILVDRKRCNRGRMKKHKAEDHSTLDVESIYTRSNANGGGGGGDIGHDQQGYNGNSTSTMRSSWLQRKSKNIEIDVRIIDDEVTIKLVQQKRINCLLLVSKVLDDLPLDLHHVAGGLIGDFYSYLFNTKICEGSSVYASAIANKLIEVVDKQYASIPVTSGHKVEK
ncbi:transcription factor bHLH10-like [Bidens hawaiensis]|uniref:transcription factor bHLH10-like n=1 Tax=Bidens hawaiensis TaxID=980011 RepID=UPI00404B7A4F